MTPWLFASHFFTKNLLPGAGHTADFALDSFAGSVMSVLALILLFGMFLLPYVAIDLVAGVVAALWGSKKRHLFWILPLVNLVLYVGVLLGIPAPAEEVSFARAQDFWGLMASNVWLQLGTGAILVAMGLLSALVLAPFRMLVQRWRAPRSGTLSAQADLEAVPTIAPAVAPAVSVRQTPPPLGWRDSFRQGFTAVWRGFLYLCEQPSLWRYAVIPLVLNLLLTAFILALLLVGAGSLLVWLHDQYPPGWGWAILEVLAGILVLVAALAAALVAWTILEGILCGIFYERLARQVELQLGTPASELRELSFLATARDSVRDAFTLLGINVGFLALHLFPVLGTIVAVVATLYCDWLVLGGEYLDLPLGLRGLRREEKQSFRKQHRLQTLGLGAAVMLFGFLPLVGSVALITAAVGGVLLYHERTGTGRVVPYSTTPIYYPEEAATASPVS